jgi:hypothetical protein
LQITIAGGCNISMDKRVGRKNQKLALKTGIFSFSMGKGMEHLAIK